MPEYLSGLTNLSGIFFRISAENLLRQVDLLYE